VKNIYDWPDLLFLLFFIRFQVPGLVPFDASRKSTLFWSIYVSGAPTWYPKLALGQFVFCYVKKRNSPGRQILANPEFQSKRKKACNTIWSWVHQISSRDLFLNVFRAQSVLLWQTISDFQNTKVLLNEFREPTNVQFKSISFVRCSLQISVKANWQTCGA